MATHKDSITQLAQLLINRFMGHATARPRKFINVALKNEKSHKINK